MSDCVYSESVCLPASCEEPTPKRRKPAQASNTIVGSDLRLMVPHSLRYHLETLNGGETTKTVRRHVGTACGTTVRPQRRVLVPKIWISEGFQRTKWSTRCYRHTALPSPSCRIAYSGCCCSELENAKARVGLTCSGREYGC